MWGERKPRGWEAYERETVATIKERKDGAGGESRLRTEKWKWEIRGGQTQRLAQVCLHKGSLALALTAVSVATSQVWG